MLKRAGLLIAGLSALAGTQAVAQEFLTGSFELRAGPAFHGLEFNHKLFDPFAYGTLEDVSVELIYTPPVNPLILLGSPNFAIGGTFNTRGLEQMVHANLNWHAPLLGSPIYLEGGLGVAAVSGYLHDAPAGYRNLGCNVMGYFQAGIGADLGDQWTATLSVEHESHMWVCGSDNDGLNSLSLKLGYKF